MTQRHGFALPLVLWSVAFLTVISFALVGTVSRWLDEETLAERRFAARQNALSGLAIGRSPAVSPGDPLLVTGNAERDGYVVRISDESGRINPNYWLSGGNREIFKTLFASWRAGGHAQDVAIDSMIDWTDPDEFALLNGAERGTYAARGLEGFPPNQPFASVKELSAVHGLQDILAAHDSWRDMFSVLHNGKVSALHASAPLLEALAGFSPAQAAGFIALRAGEDGIEGTKDDRKFKSLEELAALVRASGDQAARLMDFFSLESGLRRIESTGWAQGASHRISVVVAKDQADGKFLQWEEQ